MIDHERNFRFELVYNFMILGYRNWCVQSINHCRHGETCAVLTLYSVNNNILILKCARDHKIFTCTFQYQNVISYTILITCVGACNHLVILIQHQKKISTKFSVFIHKCFIQTKKLEILDDEYEETAEMAFFNLLIFKIYWHLTWKIYRMTFKNWTVV